MLTFKTWFLVLAVGMFVVGGAIFIFLRFLKPAAPQKIPAANLVEIPPTFPVPSTAAVANLANTEIVFVPRIVDGDTIKVETVDPKTGALGKQETIRYVGMDTPETVSPTKPVECYGHEASARNKELVAGKYVAIQKDVSDKDKYGRLLRFVYLLDATNTLVDLELVKEGYARVLTIPPDVAFAAEFNAAASTAQAARLGFWSACSRYPFE